MAESKWRDRLVAAWPQWCQHLARVRAGELDEMVFPRQRSKKSKAKAGGGDLRWIEHPASWVGPDRGLGDYMRFLLVRGLGADKELGVDAWRRELENWLPHLENHPNYVAYKAFLELPDRLYHDFNRQKYEGGKRRNETTKREYGPAESAQAFLPLVGDKAGWELIAYTINRLGRAGDQGCTGEQLRNRRFDGPNAINDFLAYLKTGTVALRQASDADQLDDLPATPGDASMNNSKIGIPKDLVTALCSARHTEVGAIRHFCLWNRSHPSHLLPAVRHLLELYDQSTVDDAAIRRLPAIYVPLRVKGGGGSMSRRDIVRDLYKKICIRRERTPAQKVSDSPRMRAEDREVAEVGGQQLDREVHDIRRKLAEMPRLIIFGIHPVSDRADEAFIEEHTLDNPLPYVLSLLMPESGDLHTPINPDDAFATRVLILADGPIHKISNQDVTPWKLLSPTGTTGAATVTGMEKSLLKAAQHLQKSWPEGDGAALIRKLETTLVQHRTSQRALTRELANTFVDHLLEQARVCKSGAWFVTILQLVTLVRGGIRENTLARALAGYVLCTLTNKDVKRAPEWLLKSEMPLWTPALGDARVPRLENVAVIELRKLIQQYIQSFKRQATGLIRLLRASRLTGLDEYEHYFESPEVPEIRFDAGAADWLIDFEWPRLQLAMRRRFQIKVPEKHALLRLLMADECARRAAIVQRHSMAADHLSLIQKRYVISAINHGLDGLSYDRSLLISDAGSHIWRWIICPLSSSPRDIFLWIHQELYTAQLNGNRHLLSREYGAEQLKRALIRKFLLAWRRMLRNASRESDAAADMISRNEFLCLMDLLEGLVHVGSRTVDLALERWARSKRNELIELATAAVAHQPLQTREAWTEALRLAARRTLKFKLDGGVIHQLTASRPDHAETPPLDTLPSYVDELLAAMGSEAEVPHHVELRQCLNEILNSKHEKTHVQAAARLAQLTPRGHLQFLYDCLVRFAQMLAVATEDDPKPLREHALLLFNLADKLRQKANDEFPLNGRIEISPRPTRYATRLCLTLGETDSEKRNHYFQRSAQYAYDLITATSQYHIEGIASLIIHASTIRICGAATDSPQLGTAMKTLKLAERALIHYPQRSQLWVRFYLERAKVYRDQSLSCKDAVQKMLFATHCKHDLMAVIRLAPQGDRWQRRAEGVLENLTAGKPTLRTRRK